MRKISLTISACALFCSFSCDAMDPWGGVFVSLPSSSNCNLPNVTKCPAIAPSSVAIDSTRVVFPRGTSPAKVFDKNSLSPQISSSSNMDPWDGIFVSLPSSPNVKSNAIIRQFPAESPAVAVDLTKGVSSVEAMFPRSISPIKVYDDSSLSPSLKSSSPNWLSGEYPVETPSSAGTVSSVVGSDSLSPCPKSFF